jgi:hypothetical protein
LRFAAVLACCVLCLSDTVALAGAATKNSLGSQTLTWRRPNIDSPAELQGTEAAQPIPTADSGAKKTAAAKPAKSSSKRALESNAASEKVAASAALKDAWSEIKSEVDDPFTDPFGEKLASKPQSKQVAGRKSAETVVRTSASKPIEPAQAIEPLEGEEIEPGPMLAPELVPTSQVGAQPPTSEPQVDPFGDDPPTAPPSQVGPPEQVIMPPEQVVVPPEQQQLPPPELGENRPVQHLDPCPSTNDIKPLNRITNNITASPGEFPPECGLGDDPFVPRNWSTTIYTWKASALCHKPLYFQEMALERYGHSCSPLLQPIISGAHFFGAVIILPYSMGIAPPLECQYALGYYRPGSCAPYMIHTLPLSAKGALYQGAVAVGLVFLIP